MATKNLSQIILRKQQLRPPKQDRRLARPFRRRHFSNELLVEKFDKYLAAVNLSSNTRLRYGGWVKQFGAFLGDRNFAAATKQDVRAFLATLYGRNLQGSTMASALFALRAFYAFLELGDQVDTSAPRYVETRKLRKRLPQSKSEEEIERIIAAARTPRDLAILELGYASGLRVSELAHLRCEDVNLRARSLIVRQGKGGNDRIGLFGRKAAAALTAYLNGRQSGPLFCQLDSYVRTTTQRGGVSRDRHGTWWGFWREPNRDGKRFMKAVRLGDYELPTRERARLTLRAILAAKGIKGASASVRRKVNLERGLTPRQIFRIVVQVAKRAGITGMHPHVLRHSCATHCMNHGMDVRYVQELLGHESLVTTAKYLHVATAQLKSIHTKFHPGG